MNLGADATNQEIAKRRELTQDQDGPVLKYPVGLWERSQNNVAFFHDAYSGLGSLTISIVYSGSESP
jgi:hypothetical protein